MKILAEYIWLDGSQPTQQLRSKTKILQQHVYKIQDVPEWAFDGSSTNQSTTGTSDLLLKPVHFVSDPIRKNNAILVMCEVLNADGTPHSSNTRSALEEAEQRFKTEEPIIAFEQEYTLFSNEWPHNWPHNAYPEPQGKYYCAVGADRIFGRELVEEHTALCLEAGLQICGINAEVMPSQWEFQIGPLPPLQLSDELWIARWLLHRLGERHGITVSLEPKPMSGDWNGAGAHANFSTLAMREQNGLSVITEACEKLGRHHEQHISVYGANNHLRLTGAHETCSIKMFKYGTADRGASIRIPLPVAQKQKGYLEDRRPGANMDPYLVSTALLETICGNGFKGK